MSTRSRILAVGVAVGALVGVPSVAAWADEYVGPPPTVKGESFTRTTVQASTARRDPGLPITGGDIAGLTMAGVGAIGIGTVLVRRGRTRSATA